jgi:DNA modification methylase
MKELKDYLYYEEENPSLKIYCGDSQEILSLLPKADVILTDPPYGMDYQSARRTDRSQWKDKIHGDNEYPQWIFSYNPINALFVCCRWDNLYEIPKPKSFIVWDKRCHSMGDLEHEFGRQWEAIAFYPQSGHKFIHRPKDLISVPKVSPDKLTHPNEKPTSLFRPLLESHGGIVIDPFMGSGSVLLCCKELNRNGIGIEISEKYCAIAKQRLKATTRSLF